MPTCASNHDQLLDFVYGLMEPSEQKELSDHLTACSACREALAEAEQQQAILAQAARPLTGVPIFTAPPVEPILTLPMPPRAVRPAWRIRSWMVGSSAAAVILIGLLGVWGYESSRQARVALFDEQKALVAELTSKQANLATDFEQARTKLKSNAVAGVLQVQAMGPHQLHAAGQGILAVTTRDATGKPTESTLHVSLTRKADNKILFDKSVLCKGEARLELPAFDAREAQEAKLVVQARTIQGSAQIEETLATQAVGYLAQLATNKTIYKVGDTLFYRVLALERFALIPPTQPLKLRLTLLDPAGRTVQEQALPAEAGGIGAGQMRLPETLIAGPYTLQVQADDATIDLPLQKQALEIVREVPPDLQLDKSQYKPGETVNVYAYPSQNRDLRVESVKLDGLQVQANFPKGQLLNRQAGADQTQGNAASRNQANSSLGGGNGGGSPSLNLGLPIQIQIPQDMQGRSNLRVEVELSAGAKKEIAEQSIPLTPTQFLLDFYPEGGDLVPGVPQRLYYRIRSSEGESVEMDGKVTLKSRGDTLESKHRFGLGSFSLTYDPTNKYSAHIVTSAGEIEISEPFARLGIRPEGMVLHVPNAVASEADPIQVDLRQPGPVRRILLLAECRGQLVEQRWVEVQGPLTQVQMKPASGSHGVVRVTAYELIADQLQPLAERLVYRVPTQRLELDIANLGQLAAPGPGVRWNVQARDESNRSAPCWVLAAVIDSRFRPRERSLDAHFFFAGMPGVRSLEELPLILNDSPASRELLDFYLGSYGWRRFVREEIPALARLQEAESPLRKKASMELLRALKVEAPSFFSLENGNLAELREKAQVRLDLSLIRLQEDQALADLKLTADRQSAQLSLDQARAELESFEQRPAHYFRLVLKVLLLGLIGSGIVLMLAGLVLLILRSPRTTSAFGVAALCLLVGIGLTFYLQTNPIVPIAEPNVAFNQRNLDAPLAKHSPLTPLSKASASAMPIGEFGFVRKNDAVDRALPIQAEMKFARALNLDSMTRIRGINRGEKSSAQTRLYGTRTAEILPRPTSAPALIPPLAPSTLNAHGSRTVGAVPEGVAKEALQYKDVREKRSITYRQMADATNPGDTLLWQPTLFLPDGSTTLSFDLPVSPSLYRILLLGHSNQGRFGYYEANLELP